MADGYDSKTGQSYTNEYKGDKSKGDVGADAQARAKASSFSAGAAGAKKFRNQKPGETIQDYIAAKKDYLSTDDAAAALAKR